MEKRRVLKKFKVNENHGTDSWTNIRINFKNSKKPDGKLKVWIDENLLMIMKDLQTGVKKNIRETQETGVILNLVFILTQTKKQNINT